MDLCKIVFFGRKRLPRKTLRSAVCFLSSDAAAILSTEAEGFVTVRLAIWTATKEKDGGVLPGKVADKPALRPLTSRLTEGISGPGYEQSGFLLCTDSQGLPTEPVSSLSFLLPPFCSQRRVISPTSISPLG